MLTFKDFLAEEKSYIKPYKYRDVTRSRSYSPYWSGLNRRRKRIGGITYTITFKNGKAHFTKRMRTPIGKKRYK